jgi:hypothetical protein
MNKNLDPKNLLHAVVLINSVFGKMLNVEWQKLFAGPLSKIYLFKKIERKVANFVLMTFVSRSTSYLFYVLWNSKCGDWAGSVCMAWTEILYISDRRI